MLPRAQIPSALYKQQVSVRHCTEKAGWISVSVLACCLPRRIIPPIVGTSTGFQHFSQAFVTHRPPPIEVASHEDSASQPLWPKAIVEPPRHLFRTPSPPSGRIGRISNVVSGNQSQIHSNFAFQPPQHYTGVPYHQPAARNGRCVMPVPMLAMWRGSGMAFGFAAPVFAEIANNAINTPHLLSAVLMQRRLL